MGRPRRHNTFLPERVYLSRGWHFFVDPNGKWHKLGKAWDYTAKMRYAELSSETPSLGSVAEVVDEYLKHGTGDLAARTIMDYQAAKKPVLAVFGKMRAGDVQSKHIAQYLAKRISKDGKLAPVRANREMAMLSSAYAYGMRIGMVERNPCYGVRRNTEHARDRCPSIDELLAAMRHMPRPWQLFVQLAYMCGDRRGDLKLLARHHISAEGIRFRIGKTGVIRKIEWSAELREVIDEMLELSQRKARVDQVETLYLFPSRNGQPYTDNGFKALWWRYLRAAIKAGDLAESFHFHDIRARSATDEEAAGGSPKKRLSHKTDAQTNDYLRGRREVAVEPLSFRKGTEILGNAPQNCDLSD